MRIRGVVIGLMLALGVVGVGSAVVLAYPGAAANRRAARLDASKLLAKLVLPAGAVMSMRDPAPAARLARAASTPGTAALVDLHRFYRVAGDPGAAIAWFQAHPPPGSSVDSTGSGNGPGYDLDSIGFAFPPLAKVLPSREVVIEATEATGGGTAIRVDAQDVWWIPRPKSEHVPAGVREIEITVERQNRTTGGSITSFYSPTDPRTVQRITSLVDALPPMQPWDFHCPKDSGRPAVKLRFVRAPGGRPLAVVAADGSGCGLVSFTLRGKREPGLSGGSAFIGQIEKLLGLAS